VEAGANTSSLTRALARMSAALAARADVALEARLRELAGGDEAQLTAVEEALVQSYLFLGYPAALNALALWRELSGRAAPDPSPADWEEWRRRGAEVCRVVYGRAYEELRENVRALHPDMEQWMVVEGYGKVLGRPGLDLVQRELCIVALLAVQDAPRQLYSHLRGALHAGATDAQVEVALADAAELSGPTAREHARESWRRVRERRGRP
jgi:4-carboxymuconolactone decarboxylase